MMLRLMTNPPLSVRWRPALAMVVAAGVTLTLASGAGVTDQGIVVLVNDEPVTSYDVAQRQRFLALTQGFGEQVRARLKSEAIKSEFVNFLRQEGAQSQAEADALKPKFLRKVQAQVLSGASAAKRREAVNQLIDERLMLQEAKRLKVEVGDDEVNGVLTQMANQRSLDEFLAQFREQGVNPATLRENTRARIAWRHVVRRQYGHLVQAAAPALATAAAGKGGDPVFTLQVVRLDLPANADQQAIAQRLIQAATLRKRFTACNKTAELVKLVDGGTVTAKSNVKAGDFGEASRALLLRAQPGQMTPAVIAKGAVESYAVCAKRVSASDGEGQAAAAPGADKRQEVFDIYARRHLKDLKDNARIDYPKGG